MSKTLKSNSTETQVNAHLGKHANFEKPGDIRKVGTALSFEVDPEDQEPGKYINFRYTSASETSPVEMLIPSEEWKYLDFM